MKHKPIINIATITVVAIVLCMLVLLVAYFGQLYSKAITTSTVAPKTPTSEPVVNEKPSPTTTKLADPKAAPSTKNTIDVESDSNVGKHNLSILAWNVESGDNNPITIARQLKEMSGYDIYCLSEVRSRGANYYAKALPGYKSFLSKTGGGDHLMVLANTDRLEWIEEREIHELNNRGRTHRSPLAVVFNDRETQQQFKVIVNHLARGNGGLRQRQAAGLVRLAEKAELPTITVGDFNFDYGFKKQDGNRAFQIMTRGDAWEWVVPNPLVDTQWSDNFGKDRFPNSMLDFAFVAGEAKTWNPQCSVIVRPGDFPDDSKTSDHRPVELRLTIPKR